MAGFGGTMDASTDFLAGRAVRPFDSAEPMIALSDRRRGAVPLAITIFHTSSQGSRSAQRVELEEALENARETITDPHCLHIVNQGRRELTDLPLDEGFPLAVQEISDGLRDLADTDTLPDTPGGRVAALIDGALLLRDLGKYLEFPHDSLALARERLERGIREATNAGLWSQAHGARKALRTLGISPAATERAL